jgi:hypothetical protein
MEPLGARRFLRVGSFTAPPPQYTNLFQESGCFSSLILLLSFGSLASTNFGPRLPASNQTFFFDMTLAMWDSPCVALGLHGRLFADQMKSRVTAHHSDGGWTEDEPKDPGRSENN